MLRLAILCAAVGLLTGLGLGPRAAAWQPPWFCHDIECPRFTNASSPSVEIRTYEPSFWAKTNWTGATEDAYSEGVGVGFRRLFLYISGANDKQTKVPMTAPVLTTIHPGAGPNCNTTFTVAFYVPTQYQTRPPRPTAGDVFLEANPAGKVAVASHDGRIRGWSDVEERLLTLGAALDAAGIPYQKEKFATAEYDAPFRLFNRHNEVWFYL